ncbi:putative GDP-L-fucose synthase 2 [Oryza brachyantha]|uniref:putative GDP-L-fucose synthase 2 n=1 Tax=Oryza brachyantha TaxID=4533 RepID=UPI001ADA51A8|nr:putative GDP-L-fucose synthase 2 [Oryza brachyantha]
MPQQHSSSSSPAKAVYANGDGAVSFLADKSAKVFVAGHRGMVGSAVHRKLAALGFTNVFVRTRAELDLACQPAVEAFFDAERPRYVILAAAKVGGVHASSAAPAEYLTQNLRITVNVVDAARRCGSVRKLLVLASSTIYPADAPQPMPESALLSGPPAAGSEWYAIPKIAGIKMCQAYRAEFGMDAIVAAPNNLYGPREPFPSEGSHVIPVLIRRFHHAKATGAAEVAVWGTGAARREFTHVDDLADAVVVLMERYSGAEHVNVGSGGEGEVTVRELAEAVREAVGYEGRVAWDASRPDGVARRLLDSGRMRKLGWEPKVALRDGIRDLYRFYLRHQ